MFNTVLFRALTALGLLAFSYSHAMTLHQIHIITRHGSRYVLTKNHTSLGEGTSAFLTSTGIQQMHDLGIQLRDKYSDHFDFLPNYDPQLVYFESSDFDRTIVSASALASGLFHVENSTVPVHVPVHTPEWIQIQEENDGLLRKLATIRSFQKYADANGRVSLAQVWNVYDAIYVAKSECESNAQDARVVCESLEDPFVKDVVSDTEFEQLRRLVGKSEFLRYRTHSAARFVAYNLLARITSRIVFEDAKFSREDGSAKIYLYSGHYPLLLALFAALDHTYSDDGIPNYSTAIVIEVYEDENKEKRVVYNYHGGQGLEDATIQSPVRFLGRHCDAESCPFENLLQLVEDCQVDVCLQYEEVECEARTGLATFGGAVLGLVVGIIGMFFWGRVSHEKKASTASRSTEQPLEYSPKELSSAQQDDEHNLTTISTEEAKFEHHDDKSEGGASFL